MNGGTPTYRSLVLVLVKPLLRKCAVGDKWHKWGDGGEPHRLATLETFIYSLFRSF